MDENSCIYRLKKSVAKIQLKRTVDLLNEIGKNAITITHSNGEEFLKIDYKGNIFLWKNIEHEGIIQKKNFFGKTKTINKKYKEKEWCPLIEIKFFETLSVNTKILFFISKKIEDINKKLEETRQILEKRIAEIEKTNKKFKKELLIEKTKKE